MRVQYVNKNTQDNRHSVTDITKRACKRESNDRTYYFLALLWAHLTVIVHARTYKPGKKIGIRISKHELKMS